jgi:hypothetical protein
MAEQLSNKTRTPRLRVSDSVKRSNDFEHTKAVIDHYISACTFVDEIINPQIRDVRIFYEAYNNRLPDTYFRYVLNPLNSSNNDYTNWPARLRPYSIIRPNIDLIEGEYEKRPFSFAVKVGTNSDTYNAYQEQLNQQISASLEQQFINLLNEAGQDTGVPSQEVELPEKLKKLHASNYRDKRAEMGETALGIIIDQHRVEELLKRCFRDWEIAGEVYTYKGIRGGRMVYERVSPLDMDYDKSPDNEYVEDGQWCVRRLYMTPADVQDNFYKELDEKEIDVIEDENGHITFRAVGTGTQRALRDDRDLRRAKVVVFHVVWKYMKKIGILSYPNPTTGEIEEIEVPETYKVDKELGESVEWFWVNEVWEGYRIGAGVGTATPGFYVGIKPLEGQRNTVNNASICKLPYNGKRFSDTHSQNISLVEMGLPYETLHRILHFNLEKTIAKSKGKILMMDWNAIPKKFGWDEEKWLYWADAMGLGFLDRNQPGADKSFNQYTAVDMGLYQHINNIIELMEYIKREWDELLGITRQRKGQQMASDSVRGTQAAINQSTTISEVVFSRYEEFVRAELQGLLDLSKIVWKDGFNAAYQGDDLRTQILNIDEGYCESDMGVFISRSPRDLQNLEMVRQQVQAFAQNGVGPSTIVDIVQARSLSKLSTILKEFEAKSVEAQQQSQLSEQEAEQRLEQIRGEYQRLQGIIDERLLHVKYDREEDLELLKQSGIDQNPVSVSTPEQMQKISLDDQNKKREIGLKERTEAVKARQKDREIEQKDKELEFKKTELGAKIQMNKENNRVKLRNVVSGEKKSKSK